MSATQPATSSTVRDDESGQTAFGAFDAIPEPSDRPRQGQAKSLVRRFGELEVPVGGSWLLLPASYVTMTVGRDRKVHRLRVRSGRFYVADDPSASTLWIDLGASMLSACVSRLSPDSHALSQWRFDGVVMTGLRDDLLTLDLSYHGVFRRGGEPHAWLSGSGRVGSRPRRGRLRRSREDRLEVDLLFTPPTIARGAR